MTLNRSSNCNTILEITGIEQCIVLCMSEDLQLFALTECEIPVSKDTEMPISTVTSVWLFNKLAYAHTKR